MSFFDYTDDELVASEKLVFQDNEIVKMQCVDHFENVKTRSLGLKCKVLSGPHAGKQTTVYLTTNETDASRKVKNQFLHAFWSADEVKARRCNQAKLVMRFFTVRSKVSTKADKTYQNWQDFVDLGMEAEQAQPQQAAAAEGNLASAASF